MKNIIFSVVGLVLVGSVMLQMENGAGTVSAPPPMESQPAKPPYWDHPEYQKVLALQAAFVRNAKKVRPSVVSINSLKKVEPDPSKYDNFHQEPQSWYLQLKTWLNRLAGPTYMVESLGSGLILDARGYILTTYHTIENAERLLVKFYDGREFTAKIVGFDLLTDLAVLKVFSLKGLPEPSLGRSEDLKVGEWVMAIGSPYGLEGTVTVGVVSVIGQSGPGNSIFESFLQTDVSVNEGNSGGPLINLQGEIVGINVSYPDLAAGTGYTIPMEIAVRIGDQLIRNGGVERGWLGIGVQPLTPELAASFNLSHLRGGVLVNTIGNETPAEDGGLERGDIIIQFDGKPIEGSKALQQWVTDAPIGQDVTLGIIRDGVAKTLRIKVGRLDPPRSAGKFSPTSRIFRLL